MTKKVFVFGAAMVDRSKVMKDEDIVYKMERTGKKGKLAPKPSGVFLTADAKLECLIGDDMGRRTSGGGGNNASIALSRLLPDYQVAWVGCLGQSRYTDKPGEKDGDGTFVEAILKENHVDTDYVQTITGQPTGNSILVIMQGNKCALVTRGASRAVFELPDALVKDEPALIVLPTSGVEMTKRVMDAAAKTKTGIFAWMPGSDELRAVQDNKLKVPAFPQEKTTILSLNADEWNRIERSQGVMRKRFTYIIVTDGEKGGTFHDNRAGTDLAYDAVVVPDDEVVSTTGAGDSFISSFLSEMVQGKLPEEALKFAAQTSADVVRHMNAYDGIQPRW